MALGSGSWSKTWSAYEEPREGNVGAGTESGGTRTVHARSYENAHSNNSQGQGGQRGTNDRRQRSNERQGGDGAGGQGDRSKRARHHNSPCKDHGKGQGDRDDRDPPPRGGGAQAARAAPRQQQTRPTRGPQHGGSRNQLRVKKNGQQHTKNDGQRGKQVNREYGQARHQPRRTTGKAAGNRQQTHAVQPQHGPHGARVFSTVRSGWCVRGPFDG